MFLATSVCIHGASSYVTRPSMLPAPPRSLFTWFQLHSWILEIPPPVPVPLGVGVVPCADRLFPSPSQHSLFYSLCIFNSNTFISEVHSSVCFPDWTLIHINLLTCRFHLRQNVETESELRKANRSETLDEWWYLNCHLRWKTNLLEQSGGSLTHI